MQLFDLFFYIFATVIVVSGTVTVLNKNLIYSAFALLVLLSSVAAMFLFLSSNFGDGADFDLCWWYSDPGRFWYNANRSG
ncbi:hypothetical protein MASR1M107_04860 [Ignavibacteriales bacterium]